MSGNGRFRIAIRADGDARIGMGHIMRCIALAGELASYGAEIYFISRASEITKQMMQINNYTLIEIAENHPLDEITVVKEILRSNNIGIVITDSYQIDRNYLEEIKRDGFFLVSIDDLNEIIFPSDIVINGNIYAPQLDYTSSRHRTEFLLGPEYLLMRREFVAAGRPAINAEVRNILITVGGSDPLNLTPMMIRVLDSIEKDFKISVVTGPGFTNLEIIDSVVQAASKQIEISHNVRQMAGLMLQCDMAVSAGGTTLYELARTGTPTITVLQADNQIKAAHEMDKLGIAINLGMGDRVQEDELRRSVLFLCENSGHRSHMSKKGQRFIDGLGARRCAEKIENRKNLWQKI